LVCDRRADAAILSVAQSVAQGKPVIVFTNGLLVELRSHEASRHLKTDIRVANTDFAVVLSRTSARLAIPLGYRKQNLHFYGNVQWMHFSE
jgi:hypothetical protein